MDLVVPSSCGPSRMRDFVNQLDSTVDRSRENRSATGSRCGQLGARSS